MRNCSLSIASADMVSSASVSCGDVGGVVFISLRKASSASISSRVWRFIVALGDAGGIGAADLFTCEA